MIFFFLPAILYGGVLAAVLMVMMTGGVIIICGLLVYKDKQRKQRHTIQIHPNQLYEMRQNRNIEMHQNPVYSAVQVDGTVTNHTVPQPSAFCGSTESVNRSNELTNPCVTDEASISMCSNPSHCHGVVTTPVTAENGDSSFKMHHNPIYLQVTPIHTNRNIAYEPNHPL